MSGWVLWKRRGGLLTSRQVSVLLSVSCFTSYLSSLPSGAVTKDPQHESDIVNTGGRAGGPGWSRMISLKRPYFWNSGSCRVSRAEQRAGHEGALGVCLRERT